MSKAELVEEVANQTGLTKKTSKKAIDAMTSVITHTLARGEKYEKQKALDLIHKCYVVIVDDRIARQSDKCKTAFH